MLAASNYRGTLQATLRGTPTETKGRHSTDVGKVNRSLEKGSKILFQEISYLTTRE